MIFRAHKASLRRAPMSAREAKHFNDWRMAERSMIPVSSSDNENAGSDR